MGNWWQERGNGGGEGNVNFKPTPQEKIMDDLVGKKLIFYINNIQISASGLEYFDCDSVELTHHFNVRMYGCNHKRKNEWINAVQDGGYYEAIIKKHIVTNIRGKKEDYLLVDLRSVSDQIPWEHIYGIGEDKKEPDLDNEGFDKNGKYVTRFGEATYEEFMAFTRQGCVWCAERPTPENANKLTWIGPREFMCDQCDQDGTAQHHFGHLIGK